MKKKILGLLICLLVGVWVFFATRFFTLNKLYDLFSIDLFVYLPFIFSPFLIVMSVHQYYICENKKVCDTTKSTRIGFLSITILITLGLYIVEEFFGLSHYYSLFNDEYIYKIFLIYNPFVIFYFLYQTLQYFFFHKGILVEIEEEILD